MLALASSDRCVDQIASKGIIESADNLLNLYSCINIAYIHQALDEIWCIVLQILSELLKKILYYYLLYKVNSYGVWVGIIDMPILLARRI